MRLHTALLLSLLSPALVPAAADARVRWSTPGSYRLRVEGLGELPLDAAGATSQRRLRGRHRLRIDPTVEMGPVTVRLQLDVLTGQVFGDRELIGSEFVERRHGDPTNEYDGWTTVEPRMFWAEYDARLVGVRVGQMGAAWGMGLLDSDGHEPSADRWGVERFGDRWNGDIVDRVELQLRPLAPLTLRRPGDLVLALGLDHVYQDDQASFLDDDTALRAFGKLFYPGEEVFGGIYVVLRDQVDADGGEHRWLTTDAWIRWDLPLYQAGADLRLEVEGLLRSGASEEGGVARDVLSGGVAARAELGWRCPRVAVGLEGGFASGDDTPTDELQTAFTFDPDHRVGLILFPDALRQVTLVEADALAAAGGSRDPDELPTDGGVRNAAYLFPAVTWRPGPWRLTAGGVVAWAPSATRGADAGALYGVEGDLAAHYDWRPLPTLRVSVGAEGGVLLAGPALGPQADGEPLWKAVGRMDLRW